MITVDLGDYGRSLNIRYGRSELKTSDHRPVFATFTLDARAVDWSRTEDAVEDVVG